MSNSQQSPAVVAPTSGAHSQPAFSGIGEFLDLLAAQYFFDGPDRRKEPRLRITLPVEVEPLDEQGRGRNFRIRAVTRDISASGIGLVCQDPIGGEYVRLFLEAHCGAHMTSVVKISRCDPVGYYYNVGGTFVDLPRTNGAE